MSWVDDQYLKCERCGKEAGHSSFNCRTNEEYFFCTVCGTSRNFVLKKDEKGNPILKREDYAIDGKISLIKTDDKNQLIESIPIDQTFTTENIKEWGKKDVDASMSRIMHSEEVDSHSYIVGIVNEDNTFTQIYGRIQVEEKDNEKLVFTEYYEYEEKYEEGYGVAKVVNENGVAALYAMTEERTEEDIIALKNAAKESDGYFTLWDKEKNQIVVEFGELDLYEPIEEFKDECSSCSECEGGCHSHDDKKEHECKCGGNCGGNGSCGGNCSCH